MPSPVRPNPSEAEISLADFHEAHRIAVGCLYNLEHYAGALEVAGIGCSEKIGYNLDVLTKQLEEMNRAMGGMVHAQLVQSQEATINMMSAVLASVSIATSPDDPTVVDPS